MFASTVQSVDRFVPLFSFQLEVDKTLFQFRVCAPFAVSGGFQRGQTQSVLVISNQSRRFGLALSFDAQSSTAIQYF